MLLIGSQNPAIEYHSSIYDSRRRIGFQFLPNFIEVPKRRQDGFIHGPVAAKIVQGEVLLLGSAAAREHLNHAINSLAKSLLQMMPSQSFVMTDT